MRGTRTAAAAPAAGKKGAALKQEQSVLMLLLWCITSILLIHRFTWGREAAAAAAAIEPPTQLQQQQPVPPLAMLRKEQSRELDSHITTLRPPPVQSKPIAVILPSTSSSHTPAATPDASPSAASSPSSIAPGGSLPFEAHPRKYLMLLQGQEGFGAWSDIIWEYLDLAKTLGRTLVEPCVRNGCLEPCRCGAVVPVPDINEDNVEAMFAHGADPLDLPYIEYPCEPYTSHAYERVGRAYPLSAYLDMRQLRAFWPHIIPYDTWCERVARVPANGMVTEPTKGRWVVPNAYCGELHWHECYPHLAPRIIGDFRVTNFTYGRETDLGGMMETLARDDVGTMLFYYVYRRYFPGFHGKPNVPFNLGHIHATRHFVRKQFGGAPLIVFHWRSEHVDELMLEPCAHKLDELLGGLRWPTTPSGYRGLLMSDMPAPNNNQILWHTYVGAKIGYQHAAMDVMIKDAHLLKYDYLHNFTDTGVLMIRDFLFAQMADAYITCQGDFAADCRGCFRSISNFVGRIVDTRRAAGKTTHDKWWALKQDDLPTAAAPVPE